MNFMSLKKYQAILLDGDGVLWKSSQPLPGIAPFVDFLSEQGISWALLTNNNAYTRKEYVQKLAGFGIQAEENLIFTCTTVTVDYLLEHYGKEARLHVVGNQSLRSTLKDAGFEFTHGEQIPKNKVTAIVAGMDRYINYQKITIATRLILDGAVFIATNTDGTFPAPDGLYPGTGMVVGALQATSGVEPIVVGKPHPAIFQAALQSLQVQPEETLMVGDRLNTDIEGATALDIHTALVLSGVTSREEIPQSKIKPDFIYNDISALHQDLEEIYQY